MPDNAWIVDVRTSLYQPQTAPKRKPSHSLFFCDSFLAGRVYPPTPTLTAVRTVFLCTCGAKYSAYESHATARSASVPSDEKFCDMLFFLGSAASRPVAATNSKVITVLMHASRYHRSVRSPLFCTDSAKSGRFEIYF